MPNITATHTAGRLSLLVAVLLVVRAASNAPVAQPQLPEEHARALRQLWEPPLQLPDHMLRRGFKHELDAPRNWLRLAHKLSKPPGRAIQVVFYGGSVTVGHLLSKTSYSEQLVLWLQAAFPDHRFEVTNLARRATAATFAALCLVQDMPQTADLVVIEYNVNGWVGQCQCFMSPQTSGYEALLRKVMWRAPHAAVAAMAAFHWLDEAGRHVKFFETGEDQHSVVARRYGVPMVSVRDALYDALLEPHNPHVRRTMLLVDPVHTTDRGAEIYASLLAWGLRHQLTRALRSVGASTGSRAALAAARPPRMPPPLNPETAQEDWPTFCADGAALQRHVIGNRGWSFVDEGTKLWWQGSAPTCGAGCHKYGLRATAPGSSLLLRINAVLRDDDGHGHGAGANVTLALSYLRSYTHVGQARVECVSGCTCAAQVLDARHDRHTSELHTERMEIGPAADCVLRLTVLNETSTGSHKFRLSSVAVHRPDRVLSFSYAPMYD